MSLIDELEKLDQLRSRGALTSTEFAQAKAVLLSAPQSTTGNGQAEQLKQLNKESELARLDREWQLEQQNFLVTGRYGSQRIPSIGGVGVTVFTGVFGIIWTIVTFSMFSGFSQPGFLNAQFPFSLLQFAFPLFGICFTIYLFWSAFNEYQKLIDFERSQLLYQQKRRELLNT